MIMFVVWPIVVVGCGLVNMLISWTFSWQEVVFDFLVGILAGALLWAGTQPDASGIEQFFLVFSHGLFGLVWVGSEGFRESIGGVGGFVLFMGIYRLACTAWAAAFDRLSVALGRRQTLGNGLFSIVPALVKMQFAWVTSGVGLLIWLVCVVWSLAARGRAPQTESVTHGPGAGQTVNWMPPRVGFMGGVLHSQFKPQADTDHASVQDWTYFATTVGFTVHTWKGNIPLIHELYHTRQYVYMSDWMIPFWLLGMAWGALSSVITGGSVPVSRAFQAAQGEVGNPLEVAAYKLG